MKRFTLGILLMALFLALGPPAEAIQRFGQTHFTQGYWGQKVEYVWSWDSCGSGAVVTWKTDSVVARTFKACTSTVAANWAMTDSLYWGPNHRIRIRPKADTGYAAACSCFITGLDSLSVVRVETLAFAALTATDTVKFSTKTWSKVRTLKWSAGVSGKDSAAVYGYPIKCVTVTTSAENVNVAGVMYDSVWGRNGFSSTTYDGWGRMVINGIIPTYLVAGAYRAGNYICTSTTEQQGALGTSPAVGTVLGKVLYAGTAAGRYPVMVNTE